MFKGISVLLVNTEKGFGFLEQAKNELFLEEHTYEEALRGNGCLRHSAKMGEHRNEFFSKIKDNEFEKLVWNLLGETKASIKFKEFKYNIKYLLLGR